MFRSGKILKVNDNRGYCFIEIDDDNRGDGGRDGRHIFAHFSVFNPRVQLHSAMVGKAVRFEATEGQKGLAATAVEFLSEIAISVQSKGCCRRSTTNRAGARNVLSWHEQRSGIRQC